MSPRTPAFLASFSVTVIMLAGELYFYQMSGFSRYWLFYLFVIWPPLAIYWMVTLYRWLMKTAAAS